MPGIALVMIVRNEENTLARCLDSVKNHIDDIIIADTGSTDGTKDIASSFGAKVYDWSWNDSFSDARNFALSRSKCDYNLSLDADEYIVSWDKSAVADFIGSQAPSVGKIKIISSFMQNNEISAYKSFISRLFPRGVYYTGKIHEQLDTKLPRRIIPVEAEHDGYLENKKSARNIALLKKVIEENPGEPYYLYQLAKEYKGTENYGQAGICMEKAYSSADRAHSYFPSLVVDYIYILMSLNNFETALSVIENESSLLCDYADFHFVSALLYVDLILKNPKKYIGYFNKIEACYLRCLEIGEESKYGSVEGTGSFAALYNLGVFYEMTGNIKKAEECYIRSSEYNYAPAVKRLKKIKQ